MSSSRGDEGVSLVELLVATLIITIILVSTMMFIIQGQRTVSTQHLGVEAINIATAQLETLQLDAAKGTLPTGTTTVTYPVAETGSRVTNFTVRTSWTAIVQGTNQSICATGAAVAQQIWLVTAKVTWHNMHGTSPVIQTTEIAPAQAGAVQQFSGELAVRLSIDGTPTNLLLADDATATVTGVWSGIGSGPALPVGTVTTETSTSAGNGCIVFQNLDADSNANGSWVYTLSFAGNQGPPPLVSGDEHADSNPNGPLTVNNISLQPGVPDVVTVLLDTGTAVTVGYTGPGSSCTTAPGPVSPPPPSSSVIPVSVQNSFLTTYYANNTWVAHNTTPFSSLLLYPWSGVTNLWTGDQPNSAASAYASYTPRPSPCVVDATTGSATSVYLPVYPLNLKVTGSASTMTATEVAGGGYPMALNIGSGTSATSLPLGEYLLSHDAGGTVTPAYVWVTPAGECSSAVVAAAPPAQGACSATKVTVVAS